MADLSQANNAAVPDKDTNWGSTTLLASTARPEFTDAQLLEKWKRMKRESFDQRWVFERQWMRNIWYLLSRQWIYFDSRRGQWQDKRLAKWVPRPVNNILMTAVDSVRANYVSINYGIGARPIGEDNKNVVTAGVADDYAEILWREHSMDAVLNEFDFWLLACGNAWLYTGVDYDLVNGTTEMAIEQCVECQKKFRSDEIANAGQACPECKKPASEVMQPTGETVSEPKAKGVTVPLSPFEVAFPFIYERYSLAPYTIRMRWRDKEHYEQTEELRKYLTKIKFAKSPQERTMQIFKTLPFQSDLGVAPPYFSAGGSNATSEGTVEYDVFIKPCRDFPEGQVIRFAGDSDPTVIHSEQENLPGPLPYRDVNGNPLWSFQHARYREIGGRALGGSLIDPAIQKVDQLNQLDSHALMIFGRMANPIWLEPKGAEVEKFTGEPGLVVKWNPLVAGGNAKPERIPGEGLNASWFQYRQMVKTEAEELMGTYDIMKGQKPGGTEAYAAMNFLYERAMGRHASSFKERANAVKGWFKCALEIEREFGPDERIKSVQGPTKGWSFDVFKRADLSGDIEILIEDGTPKTQLTERATIDHLAQLQLLNPQDADTRRVVFEKFGEPDLMPSVDAQVQEAWMNMEKFEQALNDPRQQLEFMQHAQMMQDPLYAMQPMPASQMPKGYLAYKRWYDPQIHRQELIKWALSDRGRQIFEQFPEAEQLVDAYLTQIDNALMAARQGQMDATGVAPQQPPQGPQTPQQQGRFGRAQQMRNSNQNAGEVGPESSGAGGTSEPQM